jgi:2-dehydropantoate 2-reductase
MKIAIVGAGGLGGYFGARLAHGGADVRFIARGQHLAAIRQSGLTIETESGAAELRLPSVQAGETAEGIGHADLVMIAVKLRDTVEALRAVAPVIGPATTLVSFQNGVQKEDLLRRTYPDAHVMGGVAYVATTIARPGVIRKTGSLERLAFGELDGTRSRAGEALLEAARAGGIAAELSDNIVREIWRKFVFLVGHSATTTTMRSSIGPIRENPRARAFLRDAMAEVVAVGRSLGIDLPADFADDRLRFADGLPASMTSSMHHDLEAGRPLEVAWLSGAVADLGRSTGIATPLNRAVADILALRAEGDRR